MHYTSNPLKTDLEVTGHPMITVYMSSTLPDGGLFVYLEDVFPDGDVKYVAEGLLRIIYGKEEQAKTMAYKDAVPVKSYIREDAYRFDTSEEIHQLHFDLLPCSYQFKKGHRIRIAIAGADVDHFKVFTKEEPVYTIYRNQKYGSKVELPVVR